MVKMSEKKSVVLMVGKQEISVTTEKNITILVHNKAMQYYCSYKIF